MAHIDFAAQSDQTEVLFVIGMARSGTTFVADLLHEEFDYGMGPEGSFVPHFARHAWRYGNLSRRRNLNRLVRDVSRCEMLEIARTEYPPNERFDVTEEELLGRITQPTYASVVRAVFESVASHQGRSRLGSKYPLYWRCPQLLEGLFPTVAKYLWIVRDGRDVALSLAKQPWGEKNPYACARNWVQSMENMVRFNKEVSSDDASRLLMVRYEDLMTKPLDSLRQLREFTNASVGDERLQALAERLAADGYAENFGKWQSQMDTDDLRVFEAVAGDWLNRLGYECHHTDPESNLLERMRFMVAELSRRARRALS